MLVEFTSRSSITSTWTLHISRNSTVKIVLLASLLDSLASFPVDLYPTLVKVSFNCQNGLQYFKYGLVKLLLNV